MSARLTTFLPSWLRTAGRRVKVRANVTTARVAVRRVLAAVARGRDLPPGPLASAVCTARQLQTPAFRDWVRAFGEPFVLQRKLWEWAYVAQALEERDLLGPGRRGLGFAVGAEPLPALFAARGCDVLATDLPTSALTGVREVWRATGQHAASLELLNARGLCPPTAFAERVRLRRLDMTDLPDDLTGFDFVWSACALEHLGTLEAGIRFVERSLKCLRPGGVAVHTTEFNVLSDTNTVEEGPDVLYRRRDLEELAARVADQGGRMADRDYFSGDLPADWQPDRFPYGSPTHLKLYFCGHVVTSFGFIITMPGAFARDRGSA